MSTAETQQGQTTAIRDEVRRTIQQLSEMAQSECSFDQFCEAVLTKVVNITGAHGALLWQVNGENTPRLTHQAGGHPSEVAQTVTSQENEQHVQVVQEVISRKQPMGLASEAFVASSPTETASAEELDHSFLMLFSPVYNRAQQCCGTIELLQRANISTAAQEGYLRFLTQIAQLFPRWHEKQDLARLTAHADKWTDKIEFVTEIHRSIDPTETTYAIANESRRLLKCDRVSVGTWNGNKCKIKSISSQDRFDNRANVVRLLGYVATSSVSADTPFWIVGNTEGIAPEVASQINEYLDEAHSRTLAVLPLVARAPDGPDLEMRSRRKEKDRKLGALIIEYFDADVERETINEYVDLVVKHSEMSLENSRIHGEIFLLPVWQRLGWLQKLLFRDHLAKSLTGLAALAVLTMFLLFFPKELKMKVDGVMHPTNRQTIFSQTAGIINEVPIEERSEVSQNDLLLRLENPELEIEIQDLERELESTTIQLRQATFQLSRGVRNPGEKTDLGSGIELLENRKSNLESRLKLLKRKQAFLEIRSPIAGIVVTPQPKRRLLGYPAEANLAVLEVADFKGPWQLELAIPQNKIGYVNQAIQDPDHPAEVEFRIGTNPNLVLIGHLKSVASRAVMSDNGEPEFRAIVEADSEQFQQLQDELRTGAGVTAKIHCGKRSLGFCCFYQIIDYLRTRVFF